MDGAGGFGDLLQPAEQLAADADEDGELARVERNLRQIVESGQLFWAHTVSKDASDKATVMATPSWAFVVDNIVPPPSEELICSICQGVFNDPVQCPCCHVFCNNCISRWLVTHPNCPICRKVSRLHTLEPVNPIIKNIIAKLVVVCKNVGCEGKIPIENVPTHVRVCQYEEVECPRKCGTTVLRRDINLHASKDCRLFTVDCPMCELAVRGSLADHSCIELLKLRNAECMKKLDELECENRRLKDLLAERQNYQGQPQQPEFIQLDDSQSSDDSSNVWESVLLAAENAERFSPHLDSTIAIERPNHSASASSSSSDLSSLGVIQPAHSNNARTLDVSSSSSSDSSFMRRYIDNDTSSDDDLSVIEQITETGRNMDNDVVRYDPGPPTSFNRPDASTSSVFQVRPADERDPVEAARYDVDLRARRPVKRPGDSLFNFQPPSPVARDTEEEEEEEEVDTNVEEDEGQTAVPQNSPAQDTYRTTTACPSKSSASSSSSSLCSASSGDQNNGAKKSRYDDRMTFLLGGHATNVPVVSVSPLDLSYNAPPTRYFENTLNLLRQYTIESDPEWTPTRVTASSDSSPESGSGSSVETHSSSSGANASSIADSSAESGNEIEEPLHIGDLLNRYVEATSSDDSSWSPGGEDEVDE